MKLIQCCFTRFWEIFAMNLTISSTTKQVRQRFYDLYCQSLFITIKKKWEFRDHMRYLRLFILLPNEIDTLKMQKTFFIKYKKL